MSALVVVGVLAEVLDEHRLRVQPFSGPEYELWTPDSAPYAAFLGHALIQDLVRMALIPAPIMGVADGRELPRD